MEKIQEHQKTTEITNNIIHKICTFNNQNQNRIHMKLKQIIYLFLISGILFSCTNNEQKETKFNHLVEQFADIKVLRYKVPGFEELSLKEKSLVYYLTQAGLAGRDIMWDQNYKHNLKIRVALENINANYTGNKASEDYKAFKVYLKSCLLYTSPSPRDRG